MATTYKLSYFNAKGYAEPCRFCFAYAGIPWEDVRFEHGENWTANKSKFEWGVVPVLEFEGKQLGQSKAILRYLGKKFDLTGENDFESAKCDEMIEALSDLRTSCTFFYLEKDETVKAEKTAALIKDTIPKFFGKWNEIIEKNEGFLVGKKFTYADFGIATAIDWFNDKLGASELEKYPALKTHMDKVHSAPGIKDWVAKRPKTEN